MFTALYLLANRWMHRDYYDRIGAKWYQYDSTYQRSLAFTIILFGVCESLAYAGIIYKIAEKLISG